MSRMVKHEGRRARRRFPCEAHSIDLRQPLGRRGERPRDSFQRVLLCSQRPSVRPFGPHNRRMRSQAAPREGILMRRVRYEAR
jgi:hypothetical protein